MDIWSWGSDLTPQQRTALMVSGVSFFFGTTTATAKAVRLYPKEVLGNKLLYLAELVEVVGAVAVALFGAIGIIFVVRGIEIELTSATLVILAYIVIAAFASAVYMKSKIRKETTASLASHGEAAGESHQTSEEGRVQQSLVTDTAPPLDHLRADGVNQDNEGTEEDGSRNLDLPDSASEKAP